MGWTYRDQGLLFEAAGEFLPAAFFVEISASDKRSVQWIKDSETYLSPSKDEGNEPLDKSGGTCEVMRS